MTPGRALLAIVLLAAASGCATVDVYRYEPRPLPEGLQPLDAIQWSLGQLRNMNWGRDQHFLHQRARVGADGTGIAATIVTQAGWSRPSMYLSYREIVTHVRAVTHQDGVWTVRLDDGAMAQVEMEFRSERAARLFLDAATMLSGRSRYSRR